MNIPDPPTSYQQAEEILDNYERLNLAPSDAGRQLMAKIQDIVVSKLPERFRGLGSSLTSALVSDADLNRALGLERARRGLVVVIDAGYVVRNRIRRLRRSVKSPWFVPGQPAGSVYPRGYAITDLGPRPGLASHVDAAGKL